ncbi:ankyrin repeat domain-containing protein [Amycolatopsis speibonae]|uniref:Ankyrin repeat domain-containing protein n=1 Tax=Amycolatopsis speibonae TaxID=1450224 RepID=A0ABV7P997_9PSEU
MDNSFELLEWVYDFERRKRALDAGLTSCCYWGWLMVNDLCPAHRAVEMCDLPLLRELLDGGADINEECGGFTLLHHAVDVEIDSHTQTGEPLHVDVTAYLLARGADPKRPSDGGCGVTAEHMAFQSCHWLASALFEAWGIRRRPT